MTVKLKNTRKVVVISWDTDVVEGHMVSIQVEGEEKRTTGNDGFANLYFPAKFTGEIDVTITGSKSGEDTGTITVK
jgi:hypothetical protein